MFSSIKSIYGDAIPRQLTPMISPKNEEVECEEVMPIQEDSKDEEKLKDESKQVSQHFRAQLNFTSASAAPSEEIQPNPNTHFYAQPIQKADFESFVQLSDYKPTIFKSFTSFCLRHPNMVLTATAIVLGILSVPVFLAHPVTGILLGLFSILSLLSNAFIPDNKGIIYDEDIKWFVKKLIGIDVNNKSELEKGLRQADKEKNINKLEIYEILFEDSNSQKPDMNKIFTKLLAKILKVEVINYNSIFQIKEFVEDKFLVDIVLDRELINVNRRDNLGFTPVFYAIQHNPELIDSLVNYGADICVVCHGKGAVLISIEKDDLKSFQSLIEKRGERDFKDKNISFKDEVFLLKAFEFSIENESINIFKYLLEKIKELEGKNSVKYKAIINKVKFFPIENNNYEILSLLFDLDFTAVLSAEDYRHNYSEILNCYEIYPRYSLMAVLVDDSPDINQLEATGKTLFHHFLNQVGKIKNINYAENFLLQQFTNKNVNFNQVDLNGHNVFHSLVWMKESSAQIDVIVKIMIYLLNQVEDVSLLFAKDNAQISPLALAVENDNLELTLFILLNQDIKNIKYIKEYYRKLSDLEKIKLAIKYDDLSTYHYISSRLELKLNYEELLNFIAEFKSKNILNFYIEESFLKDDLDLFELLQNKFGLVDNDYHELIARNDCVRIFNYLLMQPSNSDTLFQEIFYSLIENSAIKILAEAYRYKKDVYKKIKSINSLEDPNLFHNCILKAINESNYGCCYFLFDKVENLNIKNESSQSILMNMMDFIYNKVLQYPTEFKSAEHLKEMRAIISNFKNKINFKALDKNGKAALHHFVQINLSKDEEFRTLQLKLFLEIFNIFSNHNDKSILEQTVKSKIDNYKPTPLELAAYSGNFEFCEWLLKKNVKSDKFLAYIKKTDPEAEELEKRQKSFKGIITFLSDNLKKIDMSQKKYSYFYFRKLIEENKKSL